MIDKEDISTYIVAAEMMDVGLTQHGVVFELTLAERWSVASYGDSVSQCSTRELSHCEYWNRVFRTEHTDDDELGLAGPEGLEGRFVSEGDCKRVSN